jgi:hypothetical protein
MSAVNTLTVLSNISVPNEITALATYNQGTLPVYLFIGDSKGGLYIYDISRGEKQQSFTISGVTLTSPITGLAVTDQYLFVNSPGNCFQLPLFPFYPTTNYTNNLSVVSVANCYTRDNTNAGGIVATPDSRVLFLSYGAWYLSKIYTSDAGSGLATQVAEIPRQYDAIINGVTLDFPNTTIYISDAHNARMYNYNYSTGNSAVLSNIYFAGSSGIEFRGNAYSSYDGTLAYVITNVQGVAGVLGLQVETQQKYEIAAQGTLCNTNAITYDAFGGLYMSTMNLDNSYTIYLNTYTYVPRPAPTVPPPIQKQYECGLFLPGSCKRAYVPFNPRERFGWGSPNKPYRTLTLKDIEVSCKLTISSSCPDTPIRGEKPPPPPPPSRPSSVPPPNAGASAQEISRTRNLSTIRVQNLNKQTSNVFGAAVSGSPVLDYRGRLYVLGAATGNVYYSDNYANTGATISSKYIGGTFNASPVCSLTDRTIAFGSREGVLTMFDGSSQTIVWQKNLGVALDLTPSYYGCNVYIGYGSNLNAFATTDGSVAWSAQQLSNGDTYSSSPNVQIGNVFIGTQQGSMFVYSLKDGSTLLRIPANTGPVLSSPNLGIDNRIYFGSGSNLCAFNLDRTEASSDVVMTTLCGNITTTITLAVDTSQLTRAFFSTDLGATGYVQIDSNTQNYPLSNIASNSIPVLDASYVYVVGKTGIVWRYEWNPELPNVTSNYATGSANFAPSVIINSSSQVVVATSNAIFTLS